MPDPAKPEDFMLSPKDEPDDFKFLSPFRTNNEIEPLIDGNAVFVALEEAIASARDSVYCSFWSIRPETPLLSKTVANTLKAKNWAELLIKAAKVNKIKVRIIVSDFDPVLDNSHHRRAWKGYNTFVNEAIKNGITRDQFQIFCSLHPASFSGMLIARITEFKKKLQTIIDGLNKNRLREFENNPGIWGLVELRKKKLKIVDGLEVSVFPATYHQKAIVIDNKIGFLGGLNISAFYHDTPQHLKTRAHDIFCRVQGPVVLDLERNFIGRWNTELNRFNSFVNSANSKKIGSYKINDHFTILPITPSKTSHSQQGQAHAQIHRTISSAVSPTLQVERDDIEQTYKKAISQANDFIYIENQYVRFVGLADWIIKRFKEKDKLQVIMVIPVLPEEIEDGQADPLTLHGIHLQHETLSKLRGILGNNLGLYSLVQNKKAPKAKKNLSSFGSLRIYPHSKVLIVDDLFASIGSANTNPRSFQLDSELDIGWYDPVSVKEFRKQLWKEHLGSTSGSLFAVWKTIEYVKKWNAIATKNSTVLPHLRQGVIVPHDLESAKGVKQPMIPDFLVELGNKGQEDQIETRIT